MSLRGRDGHYQWLFQFSVFDKGSGLEWLLVADADVEVEERL